MIKIGKTKHHCWHFIEIKYMKPTNKPQTTTNKQPTQQTTKKHKPELSCEGLIKSKSKY